jgi:glycerophosphoryl diester phosphodiesterase
MNTKNLGLRSLRVTTAAVLGCALLVSCTTTKNESAKTSTSETVVADSNQNTASVSDATSNAANSDTVSPESTASETTQAATAEPATGVLTSATSIPAANGTKAWKIAFTSLGVDGKETTVSGLAFVPDRPAPQDGWPVLSYAHATVGLADVCAPSENVGLLETTVANLFTRQNMAVVMSDYPGLGTPGQHPFLDGVSSGRSVLDAIRAGAKIEGVSLSTRAVLWGHSQGGHAALFAAQLAPTYAPELTVAGVVAVAPPSQLTTFNDRLNASPRRGYGVLVAVGLAAANSDLKLPEVLTADGLKIAERLNSECSDAVIESAETLQLAKGKLPAEWDQQLERNEPGQSPIKAPVFLVHGDADDLVPIETSATLMKTMEDLGVSVERKVYPGASHAGAALASLSDVATWLSSKVATGSSDTGATATSAESKWPGATGLLRAVLEKGEKKALVIAHAGGEQEAPHSTPYAFDRAIKLGADVLETDVRLSSDKQLIVHHDETVDRTTNETGIAGERTAAELASLDNANWFAPKCWDCRTSRSEFPLRGVRTGATPPPDGYTPDDFIIPTLDSLLTKYPDTVFDIEIKPDGPEGGTAVAEALAKRLLADPKPDRFIVVSFDDATVQAFRAAAPTIATSPGLGEITQYVLAGGKLAPTPVLQIPPDAQGIPVFTDAFAAKAAAEGIAIWVWPSGAETDDSANYKTLLTKKPNGIIAGRPSELRELLK